MPEGGAAVARLLLYIGAVVIIGRAVMVVLSPSFTVVSTALYRAILWVGAVSLLAAPAALLQLQLAALEMPFADAPSLVRETAWGRGWIAVTGTAALSAVLLLVAAMRRVTGRWGDVLTLMAAVALAITMGALGHAAADARFPVMARVVDAVHVLAMGGWIGGLIMTGVAASDGVPTRAIAAWRAFSRGATVLAPVALLTGVASSALRFAELLEIDALHVGLVASFVTTSRYGQLLAAKIVVVLLVVAYGARQRRRVHRAEAPPARAVVQEGGLALVALALTAILTGTEPPSAPPPP